MFSSPPPDYYQPANAGWQVDSNRVWSTRHFKGSDTTRKEVALIHGRAWRTSLLEQDTAREYWRREMCLLPSR